MYQRIRKLISASQAKKASGNLAAKKAKFDAQVKSAMDNGAFLLIVGPCSADNYDAVLCYCEQLKRISEKVDGKIIIVPRIYTTKPRSLAGAYRGMLHSPDGKTENINNGILSARKLMIDVAEKFDFFAADEMLYPELYPYFDDLLSYITIGARSSENQEHRMVASCLDVPVGIKNPMTGNLKSLAQAISIAYRPNDFALNGYEIISSGNKYAHAILRGYSDNNGKMYSNFSEEHIAQFTDECLSLNVDPRIIIDCNHFNSGKNYKLESEIAMEVVTSLQKDNNKNIIRGLMIESYLLDGRQDEPLQFGKSLTDECLGIEKTERLIYDIAEKL